MHGPLAPAYFKRALARSQPHLAISIQHVPITRASIRSLVLHMYRRHRPVKAIVLPLALYKSMDMTVDSGRGSACARGSGCERDAKEHPLSMHMISDDGIRHLSLDQPSTVNPGSFDALAG